MDTLWTANQVHHILQLQPMLNIFFAILRLLVIFKVLRFYGDQHFLNNLNPGILNIFLLVKPVWPKIFTWSTFKLITTCCTTTFLFLSCSSLTNQSGGCEPQFSINPGFINMSRAVQIWKKSLSRLFFVNFEITIIGGRYDQSLISLYE